MWSLAFASIRGNRGGFAGVFVAVLLAAGLITGLGVLLESGLRGGVAPVRYAGADVVVGAPQSVSVPGDLSEPFHERAVLPASSVGRVASVHGVAEAIGDLTVPLTTTSHVLVDAHGWSSAALTPYALVAGAPPTAPADVVVDDAVGGQLGATISLAHGGVASDYVIVGIARPAIVHGGGSPVRDRPATAFLTDARATQLWPHPGTVATVGVIARPGTDAGQLAVAIATALPGTSQYTGDRRGDVESVDSYGARNQLTVLSSSFAGVALIIALFVMANTLSLSVRQRRREFALLRAVGTSPVQIHQLIGREVLIVAGTAALLGVAPGFWLARALGSQFARAGVIPTDFALAYSPLPALAAVVLSLATALGAAASAARRPAKLAPIDALREAAVESTTLGRGRVTTAVVLLGAGLLASMTPLVVPGMFGLVGAGSSVLLLIIGVALVGPWIVGHALDLVGPLLRRSTSASVILADANARGYTHRLSAAIVPLALAITFGCVQLFLPTTVATEAATQSRDGVSADYLVSARASGISPALVGQIDALPGVSAVNPVARSSALYSQALADDVTIVPLSVQGVDPRTLDRTLDLEAQDGSLARLSEPGTIALSTDAAQQMGADVGESRLLRLGDGTTLTATVVATYGRGLGFGDITMANDVVRAHTSTGLSDYLLVSADPGQRDLVAQELTDLGLSAQGRGSLEAAGATDRDSQSWVSLIALLVILGYVALAVVNTLAMATSARGREFGLLHLIGSTARQVRAMMRVEAALVVSIAVVVGTVIAVPPLIGIAIGISGQPLPTVPPLTYLGIVGLAVAVGMVSIALPTRAAMRTVSRH